MGNISWRQAHVELDPGITEGRLCVLQCVGRALAVRQDRKRWIDRPVPARRRSFMDEPYPADSTAFENDLEIIFEPIAGNHGRSQVQIGHAGRITIRIYRSGFLSRKV